MTHMYDSALTQRALKHNRLMKSLRWLSLYYVDVLIGIDGPASYSLNSSLTTVQVLTVSGSSPDDDDDDDIPTFRETTRKEKSMFKINLQTK